MLKKAFVASLFLALLALLYGCGQNTSVNSAMPTPSNLKIMGTVFGYKIDLVASVFNRQSPLVGANVFLSGSSSTYSTVTDANGQFIFTGVPDGTYNLHTTAEGYQRRDFGQLIFATNTVNIKPAVGNAADYSANSLNIDMVDSPIITSYSPTSGEVITNNPVFTITFNEPMDTSTIKVRIIPQGVRTMAVTHDSAELDLLWSNGDRTLTATPRGSLISNEAYLLQVNWDWASGIEIPRDKNGNMMMSPYWNALLPAFLRFESQSLDNFANYRTGTGGAPGTPSNLTIAYQPAATVTTEADMFDFWNNLWLGNAIFLTWNSPTSGGPISGYNLYAANGDSKVYVKVNPALITNNQYTTNTQAFEQAFWLAGLPIPWSNPVCEGNYPFVNNPCKLKIVAVNGDGEGPGVEITAQDNVTPKIRGIVSAGSGFNGATLSTSYYLPGIGNLSSGEAYVLLSEPVKQNSVSGYVTVAGVTLTATLLTQGTNLMTINGVTNVMSVIKLNAGATNIRTLTAKLESGLKDLIGNSPSAGSGDTFVIP